MLTLHVKDLIKIEKHLVRKKIEYAKMLENIKNKK